MKACLMKVNYDPKYISRGIKSTDDLETRLNLSKQIYNRSKQDATSQSKGASKPRAQLSAPDFALKSQKGHNKEKPTKNSDVKDKGSPSCNENELARPCSPPVPSKSKAVKSTDRHVAGVAKAHTSVKLHPLKESHSSNKLYTSEMAPWGSHIYSGGLQDPQKPGPYSEKLPRRQLTQNNFTISHQPRKGTSLFASKNDGIPAVMVLHRAKSVPPPERIRVRSIASIELERRARIDAERAMRDKKIFSIHGPYPSLRHSLRNRGWVEKFENINSPAEIQNQTHNKKKNHSTPDTDDDDAEHNEPKHQTKTKNKVHPWEEENGYYGVMSYLVRNSTPTFLFTVKSVGVDQKKSGQLVNHFGKAKNFTTKAGLCLNLRSVPWYDKTNPDNFYPRCYKMDELDDKSAFIDDYHRTASISFVRSFIERYGDPKNIPRTTGDAGDSTRREPRLPLVTVKALEMAIEQCERFLRCQGHGDIDDLYESDIPADCQWTQFLSWYNLFVHEACDLSPISTAMVDECRELLGQIEKLWSQYHVDGVRNIWILKPGAKSRGRGIHCESNLEEIMKSVDTEPTLVIQKYIESPLLIYNTKFDIRQWFLVTDWNPLTIWFYKDNYLRFCSQEFTLLDFNIAIHLSSNSIQKNLKNGPRSAKLPEDNTWTSEEFCQYLSEQGKASLWEKQVVSGMKQAIVCSLLCTQEFIEGKKSAFELYGADFMLTEDLQPWLLEINSSPSMSQNTHATAQLVKKVLDDTLKVVLDRRYDRTADTGRFELAYRQPVISDPPPLEHTLLVQGKKVRNWYKHSDRNHVSKNSDKPKSTKSKAAS